MKSDKDIAALSAVPILEALSEVMLEEGVSFAEFTELAKQAFVGAAEKVLDNEKRVSDSRIAILTGMHRKDIKRLRAMDEPTLNPETAKTNRATAVVSAWMREAEYRDQEGNPLDIPFDGQAPSLKALINDFSGDMPAKAVRDELQRMGVLEEVKTGYRLTIPSYVPNQNKAAIFDFLSSDTRDLIQTIHHNLNADKEDKRFQRKVIYDRLSPETVSDFQKYSAEHSLKLLNQFDRWLASREKEDDKKRESDPGLPSLKAGTGIYFFREHASNDIDGDAS